MRLLNFLPPSSKLHARSFIHWDSARSEKCLVLSNIHTVSARFDERFLAGSSDVSYVIQRPGELTSLGLTVSDHVPLIGVQAPDLLRSLTEAYRPRVSITLAEVGTGLFDLRSLAYVLGCAVACGSSECKFPFSPQGVAVDTLSPTWTVPMSSEVVMGPGLATEDAEFQTLSSMCKMAGASVLLIMGDTVPINSKKPFQGTKLASFSLRVFSYLMSSANACGVGDHHVEAFFRGMCCCFSLWAHTDEGGWLRKALVGADYPPSSGVLSSTATEIMGLPARMFIPKVETTRVAVGMFLEMAGMVAVADSYDHGHPTVFARDPDSEDRPSSYPGMCDRFYYAMSMWREIASVKYSLTKSLLIDAHSCKSFFERDKVDSHLSGSHLIPFWWVEPSPLYDGISGDLYMPAKLGGLVEIPFCRAETVMTPEVMHSFKGALPPGTPVRVMRSPGGIRDEAISYLFSSKYREKNGLSQLEYVTEPSLGVHVTKAMFVEDGVVNGAERRWVTPHDPIPNPAEGLTNLRTCVEFTYGGGAQPSLADWQSCKASSTLGFFRVGDSVSASGTRTHRTVPGHLEHLVDKYSRSSPWVTATVFRTPGAVPEGKDRSLPPPIPVPDPVDTPASEAQPSAITQDPILREEMAAPSIPETLLTDPFIKTVASSRSGGKVAQPNVSKEASRQEGSAPAASSDSSE